MQGLIKQFRIVTAGFYVVISLAGFSAIAQSTGSGSTLPVFNVTSYGASASASVGTCSASGGTDLLTGCVLSSFDFQPGEGIHIVGGGPASITTAVTAAPVITEEGTGVTGSHTYCYVVSTADPLEGISAPSPQACVSNLPTLSFPAAWNSLSVVNSSVGPSPSFLYYVSEDGGPFQLVTVAGYGASAMDVGQRPGSRGGWPNNLPAANPNISKNEDLYTTVTAVKANQITTAGVIPASLTNTLVMHDDTAAVQAAINAGVAAGGGTVQFPNGTFLLERPSFEGVSSMPDPPYTTSLSADPYYATYSYLQIPNASTGNISIQGKGLGTSITTAPDHGDMAMLIAAGFRQRPDDQTGVLKMQNVAKGATQVTLTSSPIGISAGTDIWLYSGSFTGSPCQDLNGTANECHFSELNTVASVSGNTLTLQYPTSKRYFNDGADSFGLVVMPTVPHNLALGNMLINTYNPIFTTGMVYGLTVNAVDILGFVTHGPFGGGFKRDVTIENSGWGFGTGDASYGGTDEYDQFTNVSFLNNEMVGYGAPGAESYSLMPRLYATEGSSGFTYKNNVMYNASIFFDQTTDDTISGNQLQNGIIKVGTAYGNNQFASGPSQDASFDSYGSQVAADVDTNTITVTSAFLAPFLLQFGHFNTATIANNTFTYAGNPSIATVIAYSGALTGNTIVMTGQGVNIPVALVPDESPIVPAAPFTVTGNTLGAAGVSVGVYINSPGFTDTAPICIQNDTYAQAFGIAVYNANSGSVTLSCPQ